MHAGTTPPAADDCSPAMAKLGTDDRVAVSKQPVQEPTTRNSPLTLGLLSVVLLAYQAWD